MLHLFPGMGADHRMFSGAWRTLNDTNFIDWPTKTRETSIAGLAREIADAENISDGDSLVGTSLGGIVACEIAKIRKIAKLFLVGSAKDKSEINRILAIFYPLVDIAPLSFIQRVSGKIPSELLDMFKQSDAQFIRNMCYAIFEWEGFQSNGTTMLFRIHGKSDLVIPPPAAADLLLDGGHLITMTHETKCVQFIQAMCVGDNH